MGINSAGNLSTLVPSVGERRRLSTPQFVTRPAAVFNREFAGSVGAAFDLISSPSEDVLVPHVQHAARDVVRDQKVCIIGASALRRKLWADEVASRP
jgi:hypothetical protein